MKQNKSFKQDFIINKDYTTNQNLSKNYDNLNETNHQDFVSKKTNKLKFARGKSESSFEFKAPQAKNSYSGFKQKNHTHRFTKIFAGVSLATLIICGTVLGFAPLVSSGVGGMNASVGGSSNSHYGNNSATQNSQSTPLNLDPSTDETVFSTSGGLEIKSHSALGATGENVQVQYFSLGKYEGELVNWIILAGSTKIAESTSPAGKLISNASPTSNNVSLAFQTTPNLQPNQILVLSEKVIPISSYTVSVTAKTNTVTGSLPGSSSSGSGWACGEDGSDNTKYYFNVLCDSVNEFFSAYSGNYSAHSSTINTWFTDNSLDISNYCNNGIVINSNFSNNFGFALTNNQLSTYLPSYLRIAKDTSGVVQKYWSGDDIVFSIDNSTVGATYSYSDDTYYFSVTGFSSCKASGGYVDEYGSIITPVIQSKATAGNTSPSRYCKSNSRYYINTPTATFSLLTESSVTAYYRPAMVVDFSKF